MEFMGFTESVFIDQSDKVIKELLDLKPEEYQVETSYFLNVLKREMDLSLSIATTIISNVWFMTGYTGAEKTTKVKNLLRNNSEKKLIFTLPKRTEDAYNEVQNVKFFEFSDVGSLGRLNAHTIIREIQENLSGDTKIVVIDTLVLFGNSGHGITEKNKLFLKELLIFALDCSDIRFYFLSFPLAAVPGNPKEIARMIERLKLVTNTDSENTIKILEQRIEVKQYKNEVRKLKQLQRVTRVLSESLVYDRPFSRKRYFYSNLLSKRFKILATFAVILLTIIATIGIYIVVPENLNNLRNAMIFGSVIINSFLGAELVNWGVEKELNVITCLPTITRLSILSGFDDLSILQTIKELTMTIEEIKRELIEKGVKSNEQTI